MNAKIYCEHCWVHPHKNLNYEVLVKTMALPTGYRFTLRGMQAAYGRPLIRVRIGGQWMGDMTLYGEPEVSETAARRFVEGHLKALEQIGLFGPHLSQEAAVYGSEALALFRNALARVQGAHNDGAMIKPGHANSRRYTL